MNNVSQNFLSTLFHRALDERSRYVELRLIKTGEKPIQLYLNSPEEARKHSALLEEKNRNGWNVYVGVLPRWEKKGDSASIGSVTTLWVDMDAKDYHGGKPEALDTLLKFPLVPTMIVDSGHGYHAYWKLHEPILLDSDDVRVRVRSTLHGLALKMNADLAVKDLARVLRVPGYNNVKPGLDPVPCTLLEDHFSPELTYSLSDFDGFVAPESHSGVAVVKLENVAVPEQFDKLLKTDARLRDTWEGTAVMPQDNSRSGRDMSLANQLANYDFTPSEIAAILRTYEHGKGVEGTDAYLTHTVAKAVASKISRADAENAKLKKAREALAKIDPKIARTEIPVLLQEIITELYGIDPLRLEPFFTEDVKRHFKISNDVAKKFLTRARDVHHKIEEDLAKQKKSQSLLRDRKVNSGEVMDAVKKISLIPHELVEIAMAVHVSSAFRFNPPLWLLIIGVPSSSKTQMLTLLSDAEYSFTLDTLTENAFMSGFVPKDGGETQDLLPKLDGVCFMVKDMTTIFSMNEETVKKLLGDLTSIFDGEYAKFTATRGELRSKALFSMIGCVTPAILNKHHTYARQLGPRFFFVVIPELTEEERKTGFKIARVPREQRDADIERARLLASSFCTQKIEQIKNEDPEFSISEHAHQWLEEASLLLAQGRGLVTTEAATFKNEQGDEVEYFDVRDRQVEQPWRVYNQLKSLACALAFVRGRTTIQDEELSTLRHILTLTMPVDRSMILRELIASAGKSAKDLSAATGRSGTAIRTTLKEMEALDLVDCYLNANPGDTKPPKRYFVNPRFAEILKADQPLPEFLVKSPNEPSNSAKS